MNEWILPFQGRNKSGPVTQNFLWRSNNIYIMDNHRAALWCWLQHISTELKYRVFHIDAHYDCARTISDNEIKKLPDLSSLSFQDYLGITEDWKGKKVPLIRWDNYLYLFNKLYFKQVSDSYFATHRINEPPSDEFYSGDINIDILVKKYSDLLAQESSDKWIINIDLDYFFSRQPSVYARLQSEHYLSELFFTTKRAVDSGAVCCLTISLSPECCGGWESAEKMCYQLCEQLSLEFRLPEYNERV